MTAPCEHTKRQDITQGSHRKPAKESSSKHVDRNRLLIISTHILRKEVRSRREAAARMKSVVNHYTNQWFTRGSHRKSVKERRP